MTRSDGAGSRGEGTGQCCCVAAPESAVCISCSLMPMPVGPTMRVLASCVGRSITCARLLVAALTPRRNTLVPLLCLLPLMGPSVYLLLRPKSYGSNS